MGDTPGRLIITEEGILVTGFTFTSDNKEEKEKGIPYYDAQQKAIEWGIEKLNKALEETVKVNTDLRDNFFEIDS